MGLFGKKYVPGITKYELEHKHLLASLDSVFPSTQASSKVKRAALHTALGLAGDHDSNMSSSQKGTIQGDEFESIVSGFVSEGVITTEEAKKLHERAKKALNN